MSYSESCEEEPMRPLSFYVDRVLERIDPRSPGVGVERDRAATKVVVSLRVRRGQVAIDSQLGVPFDPIDCSLHSGARLLGRYRRVGPGCIEAFDASGKWLGDYRKPKQARHAICGRWNIGRHSIEFSELIVGGEL